MHHPQNITSSLVPAAHVAESIHWLRSIAEPEQLWLPGIEFAPPKVRAHGYRDAHVWPLVARIKGESFRVHASRAWVFPSIELRAANSWPCLILDCDAPPFPSSWMISDQSSPSRVRFAASRPGLLRADPRG